MNIYAIYINSTQKNNNFIILEEGFSWIAALFSIFWALYHKMWIVVAITVIANIIATTIIVDFKFIFQIFLILSFGFLLQILEKII
ncbi:HIT-like protein [Rickettsia prowazekii str. GvF12]|nr:HIT-like protein [Rickettsia prowazekii str. GvF12]